MPPTGIRLLGGFLMTRGGEPVVDLSGRLQALFARVLLQPHAPCSRQQIAVDLWPESSDSQARTNLRRLLLLLRRALPAVDDLLEITPNAVAWRPRIPVSVDLLAFENGVAAGPAIGASRRAALAAAVAVYTGDLLPDCFDEWILPARERLRDAFAQALDELVLLAEGERDYPAAIAYARSLLRHDPLHEAAYRRLMRLLALTGDRAGALQLYHACATLLHRELGVEPGPETRQLYDQLLHQDGTSGARPDHPLGYLPSPLVGRTAEWQALRKAWRQSSRGAPHWALISGEAGMGKSRLAEEMLAWAERQGIPAAYARSYASTGNVGYGPLVDMLRSDALRPGWEKLADPWLMELSRLLPEIHNAHPHLPPSLPLAEEWQKRRLFDALAQALVSDGRPHLLVLDDLQWADRESLEFLAFLLRYRPQARLLLMGTARSEEMLDNLTLQTIMGEAATQGQLTQLPLTPLTLAETGELAAQTGGAALDEATSRALHARSGGNPLFVVEMTRAQEGEWLSDIGGAAPGPIPNIQYPISALPPIIQAVIESRLARLSPEAREIAAQAAVLGRSFTYPVLAAATTLDEMTLVDGLDELWRRRIIREVSGDGYDFSHDRIRDVAYAVLSQARRRLLHRRAGEALQRVHATELGPVQGQLGYHFACSGEYPAAIDHYRQAAAVALERYAHAEAVNYLSAAIALAESEGDAAVYPLLAERERVNRTVRHMDEGAADLALLTPLVERMNDGSPEAIRRVALRALSRHYYASWSRDSSLALRLAQETVDLAQRCGDQAIETEALLRYGQELFGQGRFDEAAPVLTDGYIKAMAAELPILAALSLERQASIHIAGAGNQARIEELLLESLRLYREAGSENRISDVLNKLAYAILVRGNGEYGQALAYLEQGLEIGQRVGNTAAEMKVLRCLVTLYTCLGQYGRAEEFLDMMLDTVTRLHDEPNRGMFKSWLGFWLLQQGRLPEAKATQETALALMQEQQQHLDIPRVVTTRGWIAFYTGEWQQAEEHAAEGVSRSQTFDGRRSVAHALTCRGWARLRLDRVEEAILDFQRSAEILLRLEMENRAQEPLAGLAQAAWQMGDLSAACAKAVAVAHHLLSYPLDRTVDTFLAIDTCHTILRAGGHPLAEEVRGLGRDHLRYRAANIEPEHLDGFWAMPGYRQMMGDG